MDEAVSRRICSLIAGVMCSDEKMSPEERDFLKRVLTSFGLPTDTALMPTVADADVAEELAQLPETTRHQTLELVIQAAAVDGQVVAAERTLIGVIAQQLGVDATEIDQRIQGALSRR